MRPPARATAALLAAAALLALALTALARGEVAQHGRLRVSFEGRISPHVLPRRGVAPIAVSVGGRIATTDGSEPPALRRLRIAIAREGRLDSRGLPACPLDRIQPATNANALRACRSALVGEGTFAASVAIPEQSPFPSRGRILAFNGSEAGRPVIFAHVYGTDPVPTSYTLPLRIAAAKGAFATVLTASLPEVTANVAFVTGISLTLKRRYRFRGKSHSYLSAGCPAPRGFPGAVYDFAQAEFSFAGHLTLTNRLTRGCRAKG